MPGARQAAAFGLFVYGRRRCRASVVYRRRSVTHARAGETGRAAEALLCLLTLLLWRRPRAADRRRPFSCAAASAAHGERLRWPALAGNRRGVAEA